MLTTANWASTQNKLEALPPESAYTTSEFNTHPKAQTEYFHSQILKWYVKQFLVMIVG
jgi:hypothetical protein